MILPLSLRGVVQRQRGLLDGVLFSLLRSSRYMSKGAGNYFLSVGHLVYEIYKYEWLGLSETIKMSELLFN